MPPIIPTSAPIPFYIPKEIFAKYPHLKRVVKLADFPCSNCVDADGNASWHTIQECWDAGSYEPLSGPALEGKPSIDPNKGMIATKFVVLCPTCHGVSPNFNSQWMSNSVVDILEIPANITRPNRNQSANGTKDRFETEDPEELPREAEKKSVIPKGRHMKKLTDLSPKARKSRKVAVAAGQGQ